MIQMTSSTPILLAIQPADFRTGIDRFASICLNELSQDPRSGTYVVFINRSRTMIRILAYDKNGYCLHTKRPNGEMFLHKMNRLQIVIHSVSFTR